LVEALLDAGVVAAGHDGVPIEVDPGDADDRATMLHDDSDLPQVMYTGQPCHYLLRGNVLLSSASAEENGILRVQDAFGSAAKVPGMVRTAR
jgi:hypothetical protein